MEKTASQPVIMAKWGRPRPGWLLLMFAHNCNNRVVLFTA